MNKFPKSRRLVESSDYQYVFAKAEKIKQYPFLALYKQSLTKQSRLGMAISKKRVAKAHDRNRLKRLVRESFRKQSLHGLDIVILTINGREKFENAFLFQQLGKLWAKLDSISAR